MTTEEFVEYRNKLLTTLKENVCKISFKKKTGELREMICTNRIDYLPEKPNQNAVNKPRVENIMVIPTFDLNKKEFRSFLIENLLDIKILDPKELGNYVENRN